MVLPHWLISYQRLVSREKTKYLPHCLKGWSRANARVKLSCLILWNRFGATQLCNTNYWMFTTCRAFVLSWGQHRISTEKFSWRTNFYWHLLCCQRELSGLVFETQIAQVLSMNILIGFISIYINIHWNSNSMFPINFIAIRLCSFNRLSSHHETRHQLSEFYPAIKLALTLHHLHESSSHSAIADHYRWDESLIVHLHSSSHLWSLWLPVHHIILTTQS